MIVIKIVFDKNNGKIIAGLDVYQNYLEFFKHYPKEFIDTLDCIHYEGRLTLPLSMYYIDIENRELKVYSDEEIQDIERYGRVMSEEEKILEKLKPSREEVREAEQVVKFLTLMSEVM